MNLGETFTYEVGKDGWFGWFDPADHGDFGQTWPDHAEMIWKELVEKVPFAQLGPDLTDSIQYRYNSNKGEWPENLGVITEVTIVYAEAIVMWKGKFERLRKVL